MGEVENQQTPHKKPKRDSFGMTEGNYRALIIAITGLWLGSNAFGMLSASQGWGYEPPGEINVAFLATVVAAFTARTRVDSGKKDD